MASFSRNKLWRRVQRNNWEHWARSAGSRMGGTFLTLSHESAKMIDQTMNDPFASFGGVVQLSTKKSIHHGKMVQSEYIHKHDIFNDVARIVMTLPWAVRFFQTLRLLF
mmetsp:Transcript_19476/g.53590  ORF Transcript_19476/g.53590 Transcript_19476/m.53590 type:complete len:109 (-) Transcript_19476:12-338(-)